MVVYMKSPVMPVIQGVRLHSLIAPMYRDEQRVL